MSMVPLVDELALLLAVAVAVTLVLGRWRLPTVAGLLAAGALIGPSGLGWVRSLHAIEALAEVGVVLLLFTIGLEFSLERLRAAWRHIALGGTLQVAVTIAVTAVLAVVLGLNWRVGLFLGFVAALSSTAIVLRALAERNELDAPHGRFIVGVLIFQDLCVVPMVLVVPHLAQPGSIHDAAVGIGLALLKAAVVVITVLWLARAVMPRLMARIAAHQSREVFLLAILALCMGTAWLTAHAGLSLALGAFLAGMLVADTAYGHRAMGDILPLRDAFVSVFFVSLGLLFDVRALVDQPLLVVGATVGLVAAKGLLATLAALAMRFPARVAWLAGAGLAQFGEFGFVLARLGQAQGLIDAALAVPLLTAGIATMFLTPLLVRLAPHITAGERLLAPLERVFGVPRISEPEAGVEPRQDHVIIVGFGLAGQVVSRSLQGSGVPVVVLDLNASNVRQGVAQGLPAYYADATSREALHHAGVERARLVVILTNDAQALPRILGAVREIAPAVPVLVRSHYLGMRAELLRQGATEVVAEEVEGAAEVTARALRRVGVARNFIDRALETLRRDTVATAHPQRPPRPQWQQLPALAALKIETVQVEAASRADGHSLAALALRSATGALAVAVERDGTLLEHPDAHEPMRVGDRVHLVGTAAAMALALPWFIPPGDRSDDPDGAATEATA